MAGRGQRFVEAGYKVPKFLIEINGKTLLQYSIESLPIKIADKLVFIALKEHVIQYSLASVIEDIIGNISYELILLESITRGQAETVMMAKNFIDESKDLVIYNIDTYFKSDNLENLLMSNEKFDGVLGTFIDTNPKWSFALLDNESKFIVKTAEKDPISDYALTGMYHFSKASSFFQIAERYISEDIKVKGEFYIAPMYSDLIKQGLKFVINKVDILIPLGTPEDLEVFKNKIYL